MGPFNVYIYLPDFGGIHYVSILVRSSPLFPCSLSRTIIQMFDSRHWSSNFIICLIIFLCYFFFSFFSFFGTFYSLKVPVHRILSLFYSWNQYLFGYELQCFFSSIPCDFPYFPPSFFLPLSLPLSLLSSFFPVCMYWALTYILRAFIKCLVILDSAEPFIFKSKTLKLWLFVGRADRLMALNRRAIGWGPVGYLQNRDLCLISCLHFLREEFWFLSNRVLENKTMLASINNVLLLFNFYSHTLKQQIFTNLVLKVWWEISKCKLEEEIYNLS